MPSRVADRALKNKSLGLEGATKTLEREQRIPYGHQAIGEEDIASVVEVLRSDWITQGPKIEEFESAVADYCGAKYGVAFSSGTAALHAACAAVEIGPEDEVITTPLTFVATANAVIYQGGRPVFADIDPLTLNIDPAKIEGQISKKTKAIIPVHFGGLPCDMRKINRIGREQSLVIIEDACHALGAKLRTPNGWDRIGSCCYSDMVVFSLHPVKQITTGEGGMVLTNSAELAERLRRFRHHGIRRDCSEAASEGPWYYEMVDLGFNYRMTDFQSALGLSQLSRLNDFLTRRQVIAERYRENLRGLGLAFQEWDSSRYNHAWHLFVVQLPLKELRASRRMIFEALTSLGIGVNVHYNPVYLNPYYRNLGYKRGECPVAEGYYERALTLPLYPKMTDADQERVITAISDLLGRFANPNPMLS